MSQIVVDVGCYTHDDDESVETLIDRFAPRILFGFDPYPQMGSGVDTIRGTECLFARQAAWIRSGKLCLNINGLRTNHTGMETVNPPVWEDVPCFDLGAWLAVLPPVGITMKLDCEGAEFGLLPWLMHLDIDRRLDRILVEWHHDKLPVYTQVDVDELLSRLRCPVETWGAVRPAV